MAIFPLWRLCSWSGSTACAPAAASAASACFGIFILPVLPGVCGVVLRDYMDVKEGDLIEVYETRQVERTLS